MLRVDDELYAAVFEAAHDGRKSMNQWFVDLAEERVADRSSDATPERQWRF